MPTTPRVPTQTPIYDAEGKLTRPWHVYFSRVDQLLSRGGGVSSTSGFNSYTRSATLTVASTEITWDGGSAPTEGHMLTQKIIQDGTGGRQITWDATYFATTPVDIDTTLSTFSLFFFVALDDGLWHMTGYVTGES